MKMRKIKWIAVGLAALVVAVVVAGYAILSTMNFEDLRGVIQAEAKKATGRDLVLAGPIDLAISFSPAITLEDVRFANAAWGSRPQMATVKRLEVQVALLPLLSGNIAVKRLVLVKPDILLETDAQGRGNWAMATSPAAAEGSKGGTATLPSFDSIEIRDGLVAYRNGNSGEKLRFAIDDLTLKAAGRSSPVRIDLAGRYNDAPVKLSGQLGAFDNLINDHDYALDLKAKAGGAEVTVSGKIAKPMSGQGADLKVTASGQSLADLGALTGAAPPPLGPYSLSAGIAQESPRSLRVTGLALKMGGSDLAGNATLSLGDKGARVEAGLTSQVLALADFSAPGAEGTQPAGEAAGQASPYVFTKAPLPLDLLWMADAKLKLAVGEFRVKKGLALTDVDLALTLDKGKLAVRPFEATLSGGALDGAIALDAGPAAPPLKLDLTAKGLDYGRLLADMGISDGVSGTLDATVDLKGAGSSPRALAAGLDGRIEIVGGAGTLRNTLLQTSAAGFFDMLSRWTKGDSDMKLNCIVARFPVAGGVMTAKPILFDTGTVTVGGSGEIDLRDESLHLKLTPQAKEASLMSLAVPFLVGGTLKSPSVGPDPLGTAVGAAKVAGLFLNPLTAGAALVLESQTSDQNPCVAALQAPAKAQETGTGGATGTVEKATEGAGKVLQDVGKGVGEGLKSLFGN